MSDEAENSNAANDARQRSYKFGPFELISRTAELRKHGVPIRLQEQPFRILMRLLERPGEIVLREEIQQILWPDGTVVEFGHGISAAVQRLRNALQDTAGKPRYIETVARRGYRFISQVEIVQVQIAHAENTPPVVHSAPVVPEQVVPQQAIAAAEIRSPWNPLWAAAAAVFLLGLGVFIGWKLTLPVPAIVTKFFPPRAPAIPDAVQSPHARSESRPHAGEAERLSPEPVEVEQDLHLNGSSSGKEYQRIDFRAPAGNGITRLNLSPDGRTVVYVADGRLFLQRITENQTGNSDAAADATPLPGTERAGTPFWSSDGKNIAFVAKGQLKRIALDGSRPVTLGEINTNVAGAWADENILIGAVGDGIFRVPASGGAMVRVTNVDRANGEVRHLMPQFLPGNRRFLYVAASEIKGESMLYAGSLDSEERRPIMPVPSNVEYVPSSRDSRNGFLFFARGRTLLGQRFDSEALRPNGEPFEIADGVQGNMAEGAPVQLANFSAVGDTIAYRTQLSAEPVLRWLPVAMQKDAGHVAVIQNWTARLTK